MKLPLIYYGDPRLRKICAPVKEITPEIRSFVDDLIETMGAYEGAGLAAPQVGKLIRIFVISVIGDDESGYPLYGEPTVFINPKIEGFSKEEIALIEGCLSIPSLRKHVTRALRFTVHAQDIHGHHFTEEVMGWKARAILHEYDHLEGILFIDRLSQIERKEIAPFLKSLKGK